ncbi:MAG: hypothetical protein RL729_913 [Actinomycetota bacterium]|jgi:hypothetical protein
MACETRIVIYVCPLDVSELPIDLPDHLGLLNQLLA